MGAQQKPKSDEQDNLDISWETKKLPRPQSIEDECNDYYLVKVKGYAKPIMAMYMKDDDGSEGWYVNYFSKIVKEVIAWADVS